MRILLIFLCAMLLSCTPKVKPLATSTDTIYRYKERILTLPSTHTITISEPCDSLGYLRDFRVNVISGKSENTVEGKQNEIIILGRVDSIVTTTDTLYKSRDVEVIKTEVESKAPWYFRYVILLLILSLLLNVGFLIFRR